MSELVAALSKPNDLHDKKGGVAMASKQLKHMAELYASIKERMAKPGIDLATSRDTVENLHLAAIEPEAVTYAEFPAQIDDVEKAYRWLLAQGIRAENIASRQRLHRQGDPGRRRSSVERRGDEPVPHAVSYG